MSMRLIQTVTLGSGGAAGIAFNNIPQTYTDLLVVLSLRSAATGGTDTLGIYFNGVQTDHLNRSIEGNGSGVSSFNSTYRAIGVMNSDFTTANTFSNHQIYIPNYTSSVAKTASVESVSENNTTTAFQNLLAVRWNSTAAINALSFDTATSGQVIRQHSTASLYGITRA